MSGPVGGNEERIKLPWAGNCHKTPTKASKPVQDAILKGARSQQRKKSGQA
jgi:hypothetical protein